MPAKAKQVVEEKVEYKVVEYTSTTAANMEEDLNNFAIEGWRVITSIQGTRLILEREL